MADADRLVTVMRNRVSCGDRGRLLDQRELRLPYLDYPSLEVVHWASTDPKLLSTIKDGEE